MLFLYCVCLKYCTFWSRPRIWAFAAPASLWPFLLGSCWEAPSPPPGKQPGNSPSPGKLLGSSLPSSWEVAGKLGSSFPFSKKLLGSSLPSFWEAAGSSRPRIRPLLGCDPSSWEAAGKLPPLLLGKLLGSSLSHGKPLGSSLPSFLGTLLGSWEAPSRSPKSCSEAPSPPSGQLLGSSPSSW